MNLTLEERLELIMFHFETEGFHGIGVLLTLQLP